MFNPINYRASKVCRILVRSLSKAHQQRCLRLYGSRALSLNVNSKQCSKSSTRLISSVHNQVAGSVEAASVDAECMHSDIERIMSDICTELYSTTSNNLLRQISTYYFDGQGKAIRPRICCLTARAVNVHVHPHATGELMDSQRRVAMIAEMIHTASIIHDDVIDLSRLRRGKPSVCDKWGEKRAVVAGNFILAVASTMLARIGNNDVTKLLSQVVADLVRGEFMQLGSKENENERFEHYLHKTFYKTASLMAHSCQAVSMLCCADVSLSTAMFEYGRHVGMAFQLIDDALDFADHSSSSSSHQQQQQQQQLLGKPISADLKLGLATAPVLFACQQFPELNALVMRRFSHNGDVSLALRRVRQSDGVRQTRLLADTHCRQASSHVISTLTTWSTSRDQLVQLANQLPERVK